MLSRCLVSQVKHNSYFLVGVALGLWLALVAVPLGEEDVEPCAPASAAAVTTSDADEFEPHREDRPLAGGGAPARDSSARSVQRPRYYSTELGMRASLLAAVLSSEDALGTRVAALNRTCSRLQPALRFFMTASALQAAPGLANVVGFTDTREMLKPFHALKYLADNYLEEYNFFFLVSDASFVNARRLQELAASLSVSQHVYMGAVADDDSHYCSLEGGILLSNSVLRAVHGELDWCVRNSYSPHHHENLGRCVLHAAHVSCTAALQGEDYVSLRLADGAGAALSPALSDAVTAHPVADPAQFHHLHAYVSRVYLERDREEMLQLRGYLRRALRKHPPHYRNASWPAGLRADPGLAPPTPDSRFDHARWTLFNASHAFLPEDARAAAPIAGAAKQALDLVVEAARAWACTRWGARDAALVEGAWRWEPAAALRYRLLLRLAPQGEGGRAQVRGVEVSRVLGAARLVPVPYVTESARVHVVVAVPAPRVVAAAAFLRRYEAACLRRQANTALVLVVVRLSGDEDSLWAPVRESVAALSAQYRAAALQLVETELVGDGGEVGAALAAAARRLARDALVLLASTNVEFNDDFLNRVRMNCIQGAQWFLPAGFARYAQYHHPRFVDELGRKPQVNTGRFSRHLGIAAFYRADYDAALAAWRGAADASAAVVLGAARWLRCVHAPEPGLVAEGPAPPCGLDTRAPDTACLRALRDARFAGLELGARHTLAKMLLEMQADASGA